MDELEDVRIHRDLLVKKLDSILEEFAEFRRESHKRAKRFKIALVLLSTVLLINFIVGGVGYSFVRCQSDFNAVTQRAQAIRAKTNENYIAALVAYRVVRDDPSSSPEEVNRARRSYWSRQEELATVQSKNPIEYSSNCQLFGA